MGVPFSAEAVRLQRVPQGNMQIALETKPEKPATGPEGVEPGTKVEVTSLARSSPTLGACDSDPKFWLGMELSDRTFCLVHTRAPSTGGAATDGTETWILPARLLPPRLSPPVLTQAQPPHSGLGRSRLRSHRAPTFRAGPGAQPPLPPKPPPGCWPPGGTCRSAPPGSENAGCRRTLQKVLARGSAGRRGLRADTRKGNFQIVPPHTESA